MQTPSHPPSPPTRSVKSANGDTPETYAAPPPCAPDWGGWRPLGSPTSSCASLSAWCHRGSSSTSSKNPMSAPNSVGTKSGSLRIWWGRRRHGSRWWRVWGQPSRQWLHPTLQARVRWKKGRDPAIRRLPAPGLACDASDYIHGHRVRRRPKRDKGCDAAGSPCLGPCPAPHTA
jgi:hypothetical protein